MNSTAMSMEACKEFDTLVLQPRHERIETDQKSQNTQIYDHESRIQAIERLIQRMTGAWWVALFFGPFFGTVASKLFELLLSHWMHK
jgi:hypothetical protein